MENENEQIEVVVDEIPVLSTDYSVGMYSDSDLQEVSLVRQFFAIKEFDSFQNIFGVNASNYLGLAQRTYNPAMVRTFINRWYQYSDAVLEVDAIDIKPSINFIETIAYTIPKKHNTLDIIVMLQGIAGECLEYTVVLDDIDFDVNNGQNVKDAKNTLIKEAGDILWYCVQFFGYIGVDMFAVMGNNDFDQYVLDDSIQATFVYYSGKVVECVKKIMFHLHDFNNELENIIIAVAVIARTVKLSFNALKEDGFFDVSVDDIIGTNIEKLKKRYPDKFTGEQSENRTI